MGFNIWHFRLYKEWHEEDDEDGNDSIGLPESFFSPPIESRLGSSGKGKSNGDKLSCSSEQSNHPW